MCAQRDLSFSFNSQLTQVYIFTISFHKKTEWFIEQMVKVYGILSATFFGEVLHRIWVEHQIYELSK